MVAKTKIVYPFFEELAEQCSNKKVREILIKFACNKFMPEMRYTPDKITVKDNNVIKTYDLTGLSLREKRDVIVPSILKVFKIKDDQPYISEGVDGEETVEGEGSSTRTKSSRYVANMFATMSAAKKLYLVSRFSRENSNSPQHSRVISATVHSGILTKRIVPARDIHMEDDRIIRIDGLVVTPSFCKWENA